MRFAKMYLVLCLLIPSFAVGMLWNQHVPHPIGPPVVMQVLDPSLEPFAPAWQAEIGRRFPHSVGILCHGGYFLEGQWITSSVQYQHLTTVQEVVKHVQAQYPDRTIVLLACNVDHHSLNIPGVYYAHSSVWCVPDRAITGSGLDRMMIDHPCPPPLPIATQPAYVVQPDADVVVAEKSRWESDPEVVGNIFEFVAD